MRAGLHDAGPHLPAIPSLSFPIVLNPVWIYNTFMKIKNLSICAVIGCLLLLTACASAQKGRNFSPHAPMGLVMIVSNYDINWIGEKTYASDSVTVGDYVRRALGLDKENLKVRISTADDMINEADEILRKVLTESNVFRLMDKEQLLNSVNYWHSSKKTKIPNDQITADGYRYLNYRDKQFAIDLCNETGLNSLLYVTFELNKAIASGFMKTGKMRAKVKMTALTVSPTGKLLYRDEIETRSTDRIEVSGGAYSQDDFMLLLKEAIGLACYRYAWQFAGARP